MTDAQQSNTQIPATSALLGSAELSNGGITAPDRGQNTATAQVGEGTISGQEGDSFAPVTFVGVGAIGLPMAVQVAKAGFPVTGVEKNPDGIERAAQQSLAAVGSLAEAPRGEVVVVMVATPAQLSGLVDEALEVGVEGQLWIVMSTVGPDSVREQGTRLQQAGARVVDAPVTGGIARAVTGSLTLFVSGSPQDVAAAEPVLSAMGTVRRTGDALGDGQAIKVVNQHLCSIHIVAAAEALALAERLGLDPAQVLPLVESGAAGSWMLSDRGPRMLQDTDVEVASAISIFVKDSGLVADSAAAAGADVPLLEAARQRYSAAADQGLSTKDDSRVIEIYRARDDS